MNQNHSIRTDRIDALVTSGWDPIHASTLFDVARSTGEGGEVAVFDADGTLWSGDAGEALLQALAREGGLDGYPAGSGDAWRDYRALEATDPTRAYAFAAELLAGLSEADLVQRCDRLMGEHVAAHLFAPMRALLQCFVELGAEVWLVSASNRWVIQAGARLLGLPPERVLGMRTAVVDGMLTRELVPPLTNLEGKVEAIELSIGRRPAFAAGNSLNDVPMLRLATRAALMVNPSEAAYEIAREEGYVVRVFGAG